MSPMKTWDQRDIATVAKAFQLQQLTSNPEDYDSAFSRDKEAFPVKIVINKKNKGKVSRVCADTTYPTPDASSRMTGSPLAFDSTASVPAPLVPEFTANVEFPALIYPSATVAATVPVPASASASTSSVAGAVSNPVSATFPARADDILAATPPAAPDAIVFASDSVPATVSQVLAFPPALSLPEF